jgi:uncharacterized repeat protein (TIGR03803 family)
MATTSRHRRRISAIHCVQTRGAQALLGIVLTLAVIRTPAAQAQTYSVLYSFKGGADGKFPLASLVRDSAGNLYGTTICGGASVSNQGLCGDTSGYGTIFRLDTTGTETVLHTFTPGAGGVIPQGGLVADPAGNLYGVAYGGISGKGVAFKLDTTGTETVMHNFGSGGGADPIGVIRDSAGNLYGTTSFGGERFGVAFKLDTVGDETVLYSFKGDHPSPWTDLALDSAGNVYGVDAGGRANGGRVYKVDTAGTLTVLHEFDGKAEGGVPGGSLIPDPEGNLYGTTESGGIAPYPNGYGVVFKLDTTGKETVLYTFTGGADGGVPEAGLVRDSAGNLYGSTTGGGLGGSGVVFMLDTTGKETVLYSFTGGSDGGGPVATLIQDSEGNLYGTAFGGGTVNSACPQGCGVVFKVTP